MDGNASLEHITEFLAFMGIVRISGAACLQRQQDGFHHVLLCVGYDPFDFIIQVCVDFLKIILFSEYNLFIRGFGEEIADGGAQALKDRRRAV